MHRGHRVALEGDPRVVGGRVIEASLLNLTDGERQALRAMQGGGALRAMARELGVPYSTLRERVLRLVDAGFATQVRTGTASVYVPADSIDCATEGRCPTCHRPLPTKRTPCRRTSGS